MTNMLSSSLKDDEDVRVVLTPDNEEFQYYIDEAADYIQREIEDGSLELEQGDEVDEYGNWDEYYKLPLSSLEFDFPKDEKPRMEVCKALYIAIQWVRKQIDDAYYEFKPQDDDNDPEEDCRNYDIDGRYFDASDIEVVGDSLIIRI